MIVSLNDANLKMLRSISALLAKTIDVGETDMLITRFKVRYEGINAHWMNVWSDKAMKEVLIICSLLLIAEDDDWEQGKRELLFKKVSGCLVAQCHCCGLDIIVEQDYQIALIMAEAIADQILPSQRDGFESMMWNGIYEKHVVLSALTMAKQPHQEELGNNIRVFRDTDWQVRKAEMLRRKLNGQVETIEKFFLTLI